ncbi:DUF1080 domain-containing protein [Limisphaera ngatamarikiensis]|uniref:DUF1080 domain-containing protein n=1 Tax=Limisphaera ngatamarikiensis TaxID=1324935 RepID=A0A6M1RPV5_9BACT|nr:DUF1080 domain-containing protein [Limisphaera ngatamarikiensis]NGO38695.1 DUF1080 domain-containing protein [Limisphaera ngatamarikiensis]
MKRCFEPVGPRAALLALCLAAVTLAAASRDFEGRYALTLPDGSAGWLGIVRTNGGWVGSIMWSAGSVVPVDAVEVRGDTLVVTRIHERKEKNAEGREVTVREQEIIEGRWVGDQLEFTTRRQTRGGWTEPQKFTGKPIPPLPPRPDLSRIRFGEPIVLFNGRDLTGWRPFGGRNGWRAADGILINEAPQPEGGHIAYANLRTEREFEDFNLRLELRLPPNGNSGIYLRGIYEVQVADSFGKPPSMHGMGAIYSRITPTENAAKPAGEWQSYDITLVDRHVTVILNGRKIIDNQPLLGCTGGALWSDELRPGPIYLQGDHTSVEYRNLVLRPVLK